MGATKRVQLEEMEMESYISVEKFMRANGVAVVEYDPNQFGHCVIHVTGTRAQGRLEVTLSLKRQEAIDLLVCLGVPVLDEMAG